MDLDLDLHLHLHLVGLVYIYIYIGYRCCCPGAGAAVDVVSKNGNPGIPRPGPEIGGDVVAIVVTPGWNPDAVVCGADGTDG